MGMPDKSGTLGVHHEAVSLGTPLMTFEPESVPPPRDVQVPPPAEAFVSLPTDITPILVALGKLQAEVFALRVDLRERTLGARTRRAWAWVVRTVFRLRR